MNGSERTNKVFWVGLVIGWVLIGIGLRSAVMEVGDAFTRFLLFVAGFAVLHDAIVLPLAAGLSVMIDRFAPPTARIPVRLGLAGSWLLLVVSLPGVLAFGALPDNPSILPANVGRNLAVIVAALWVGVAIASAVRLRSVAAEPPTSTDGSSA